MKNAGPICIYHANCPDGFTAAWIMRRVLPDIHLYPASYGDELLPDCSNRDVYFVDFTYGPDAMLAIADNATRLTVLDHHETAITNCAGLDDHPNVTLVLDMDRSGARIAFDWAMGHYPQPESVAEPVERFVNYIQKRDLWKFEEGDGTAEFFAAVTSYPYTLADWNMIVFGGVHKLIGEGFAISRYREQLIAACLKNARVVWIGAHQVLGAPCPYAVGSDVANRLAEANPDLPFAAYWVDTPAGQSWGLRVRGDSTFNVAELAREFYGGGGHPKAAGFTLGYGDDIDISGATS